MRVPFLRLAALLLTLAMLLGACSQDDGADRTIRYDITQGVDNLDPQFATDETARMIIGNTFEGLFRQLPDGSVEPAVAQSYEVSPDGLRYTFHLRTDVYWSPDTREKNQPSERVTAHDFVFAFRRMFNPAVPSPFATSFLTISNAGRVLEGAASVNSLGVSASGDHTLVITLERQETALPTLLASTYAAPCREAFFDSTMGRYGLEANLLLYNGPFRVTGWNNESGISLSRNAAYAGEVVPRGVELILPEAVAKTAEANYVSDRTQRFLNGTTDACKIDYSLVAQVRQSGATVTDFEDTVWVLALNSGTPEAPSRFASVDIRQAVAYAVDRSLFAPVLPENMRVTDTLIPPAIISNGRSFREAAGNVSPLAYSPDLARRSYYKGMADMGTESLSFGQLLISDDDYQSQAAGYIQRTLQQQLASPVELVRVEQKELLRRVMAGDYTAAIFPLTAGYSSPDAVLSYFQSDSPNNFTGFSNERFDALLRSASTLSAQEREEAYSQAEQLLLTECPVIPLYFETSYYGAAKGVSGIAFAPFLSGMRFQNARKTS